MSFRREFLYLDMTSKAIYRNLTANIHSFLLKKNSIWIFFYLDVYNFSLIKKIQFYYQNLYNNLIIIIFLLNTNKYQI